MALQLKLMREGRESLWRATVGFILSTGAPLGWVAWQWLAHGVHPMDVWCTQTEVLTYMQVSTGLVFTAFGFFLGRAEDRLTTLNRELAIQSFTDALTGLPNRRAFMTQLATTMAHARRTSEPLALVIVDIDHFKHVNDRYGHLTGDEVLKFVARALQVNLRSGDFAARIGGEEFALVLPDARLDDAEQAAVRLLEEIRQGAFVYQNASMHVTVSAGVAELNDGDSVEAFLGRADRALYLAKASGRNRVATERSLASSTTT